MTGRPLLTCLHRSREPGSLRCTDRWIRLAIINAIRLIACLASAVRRVRFFQVDVVEPARRPKW